MLGDKCQYMYPFQGIYIEYIPLHPHFLQIFPKTFQHAAALTSEVSLPKKQMASRPSLSSSSRQSLLSQPSGKMSKLMRPPKTRCRRLNTYQHHHLKAERCGTTEEISKPNVKSDTCRDRASENYHLNLQFFLAIHSILLCFRSLFQCAFTVCFTLTALKIQQQLLSTKKLNSQNSVCLVARNCSYTLISIGCANKKRVCFEKKKFTQEK